jgi:hypothetical protein
VTDSAAALQVESPQFSPNIIADVGWVLFGVRRRAAFPYWFQLPRRRQAEIREFLNVIKGWDFDRVVTSHLDMVTEDEDAKDIFLRSFDYIVR